MSKLTDALRDVIKHTNGLGFIDMVKLVGTGSETRIEAVEKDRAVVLFGQLYQPVSDLDGTIGLSRLNVLRGYLGYDRFSGEGSSVTVVKELRKAVDTPVELLFEGNNNNATYRFMSEDMVNTHIKVPPFKGATWDVVITPTAAALADLTYFASVLGSFEPTFIVSVKDGALYFSIGTGTNDRSVVKFSDGISHRLKQWAYPLSHALAILKLSSAGECKMSFSDMGALKIDIDSGVGKYEYILPARQQ